MTTSQDAKEILERCKTILVIDWPSKDVPDTLTLAGFNVVVKGGPGPEDYFAHEVKDGKVESRRTGRPPDQADVIYSYRPLSELPEIISLAKTLGAKAIWTQSALSSAGVKDLKGCWLAEENLASARDMVESAGLKYISQPYIGQVVREMRESR